MNELWELQRRDPILNVLREQRLRWHYPMRTIENGVEMVNSVVAITQPTTTNGPSGHIAAFDLDGTLSWSDRGKIFVDEPDQWLWFSPGTPAYLNQLHREGWEVVWFVNQNINNNADYLNTVLGRLQNMLDDLDFVPAIYVAITNDEYRKPETGMWDLFLDDRRRWYPETGLVAVKPTSFYVGDAYGPNHENVWYQRSNSDRQFAENLGITMYTPDEILPELPPLVLPENGPALYLAMGQVTSSLPRIGMALAQQGWVLVAANGEEVGYQTVNADGVRQNRDNQEELETIGHIYDAEPRMFTPTATPDLDEVRRLLGEGRKVLVMGNFASEVDRLVWIQLAEELEIPMGIIWSTRQEMWPRRGIISRLSQMYIDNFSDPRQDPHDVVVYRWE